MHFVCLVFVAKAGTVSLTCDSATTGNVNWVFIPHGDVQKIPLKGTERRLEVAYEDTPELGEYSCWSGETKLWSAHLVLDAQDTRAGKSFILSTPVISFWSITGIMEAFTMYSLEVFKCFLMQKGR